MKNNKWFSFFFGDVSTTAFFLIYTGDWGHEIWKIISALLIGIVGGIGGLIAKDFYPFFKKKLITYKTKIFNTKNKSS